MILVIRSDLFYSIGASRATKITTASDPRIETDHDLCYQVIVNRMSLLLDCLYIFNKLTSYVNEAPGGGFLQYFTHKKTSQPSPLALDNKLMHGQLVPGRLPFLIYVPQHSHFQVGQK